MFVCMYACTNKDLIHLSHSPVFYHFIAIDLMPTTFSFHQQVHLLQMLVPLATPNSGNLFAEVMSIAQEERTGSWTVLPSRIL